MFMVCSQGHAPARCAVCKFHRSGWSFRVYSQFRSVSNRLHPLSQLSVSLLHSLAPSFSLFHSLAPSLSLSRVPAVLVIKLGSRLLVLHLHGHILTGLMLGSTLDCFLITGKHTQRGHILQSCSAHHLSLKSSELTWVVPHYCRPATSACPNAVICQWQGSCSSQAH